ncbi:CLUMA_CG017386, isoform A [Clunio marinus]|uniref:tRNA-specific adenosine deaminase 1 n=1 Tax=Clunio marinus TaxID=568069 RepID=A0A1J1IW07_9DIPT|nr:CLUMA_CG017386, isoform A [Clunio marinus]
MDQMELANKISELCLSFYDRLPSAKRSLKSNEWTIYSAIVMESDDRKLEVVSCGTGTKCIGSMMLSEFGDILNDSHAEVICRRAFIRYLLFQIRASKASDRQSIFQFDEKTMKFKLMNVKFHMFTTSSPCGDASIYSTNDNQSENEEPEAKKVKMSELPNGFTGAKLLFYEDVEDVMAQTEGKIRIKPGKGDRTMSLSCSDKIARWNMMGIQGCLLSSIVDPIYLNSVILADGTSFNQTAMERALYRRFSDADKFLNHPFKLHRPTILVANNKLKFPFCRNDTDRVNPSANSIIYSRIDESERPIEVGVSGKRQGVTKKQMQTRKAHLKISKIEIFTEYLNILNEFPELKSHLYSSLINLDDLCYKDVKTSTTNDYNLQWRRLKENFLPNWTTKNENLLNFKSC